MKALGMGKNGFQKLLDRHEETGKARHIVGVHNCLSARTAKHPGFEAVWISRLALSLVAGKCARNELSWTDITDAVERIAEICTLTLLFDGDEGFGDNSIARIFASRAGSRGAACVSFEDKKYPKKNSFAHGVELCFIQALTSTIKACKGALSIQSASIISRTDSLVVNEGANSALERAYAYSEAGADAIIVHSRATSIDELAELMSKWGGSCPIIAIPTTYDQTAPEIFDDAGVSCVIWVNQLLRASIYAVRAAGKTLHNRHRVGLMEASLVSVKEALSYADCGFCCS